VKNLKLVILVCGVVGLLALILPLSGGSRLKEYFEIDSLGAIIYAAIFVLPAGMAAMALARPPIQAWQSGVALAGFVLGVVKFHVWDTVLHLGGAGLVGLMLFAAIVVGTIAAVVSLLRPEAMI